MSILQFLRILWAYRMLTVAVAIATVIGAAIAIVIMPPRYEAKTRVMLNVAKPDPVTGQVIGLQSSKPYILTQVELVRDYSVASRAVDQLGWLSNPAALTSYGVDADSDGDLRRALAQRIIDRTTVEVPPATNILEIGFGSTSADDARAMANALRDAYIEATLDARRKEATRNAEWFTEQAQKERTLLAAADVVKTDYERANGIVMQDDKTDIETARLRALSGQSGIGAPMMAAPTAIVSSPATIQLAQLDAQITQASATLGPNHPTMVQLRAQRVNLAKVVAQDQVAAASVSAATTMALNASAGALNRAVSQQTSRIIANRDKIEKLTELQAQVNLHRDQMDKALERSAQLRQEAGVADSGISVLSEAVTPKKPAFPNKPLILGGSVALGIGIGLLLSLLLELLSRKVRGPEDLINGFDVPLLAVIGVSAKPKSKGWRLPGQRRRSKGGTQQPAVI